MLKFSKLQWFCLKTLVFIVCLSPFLSIAWDAFNDLLGADPIQRLHFRTGDWTLRFLLISLAMTPLRKVFKSSLPIRFRRMLGLFCFFYASLHLLVWLVLDQSLSLENMLVDVPESPYIILGLLAYTMLLPLALTSNLASMRLLGPNWQSLHRSVYLIAVLGLIHFFWLTKLDNTEPIIYALVLGVLLAFRWPIIKRLWHRQ
ncbi:sulfoxide reductase heme-binding subunit YedZ [Cycloclasticus sp. 46_120_T64]|nr:sulfoxide reductase heme-binding subunit YedZ [Cycloclasticus sp. 46_120_T64]